MFLCIGQSGKKIPAGSTTALRIRCNDFYIFLNKIIPVADVFGISLADKENDCRSLWGRIFIELFLPAFVDQSCLFDQCDIMLQCESYHIGITSFHNRSRLCAGTSM